MSVIHRQHGNVEWLPLLRYVAIYNQKRLIIIKEGPEELNTENILWKAEFAS